MLRIQPQKTKRTGLSRKSPEEMGFSAVGEISTGERTLLPKTSQGERGPNAAEKISTGNRPVWGGSSKKGCQRIDDAERVSRWEIGFSLTFSSRRAQKKNKFPFHETARTHGFLEKVSEINGLSFFRGEPKKARGFNAAVEILTENGLFF